MELSAYKGKVSECHCSNRNPETPMPCNDCFCRGYVAECLACMGTGQKTESIVGGEGVMRSTCPVCGGKGKMGTNKPADWDVLHPSVAVVEAVVAEIELESIEELEPVA